MPLDPVASGDPHVPAHNEERDAINALEIDVSRRIPLPSGASTGDLLRWDGTAWVTTETRFFEGNGSPNGKVAAPVGSRYVDKQATGGAVEWVKNSGGTGNTGWASAVGFYNLSGQAGVGTLSGPSGEWKRATVNLNTNIFGGVAPRAVLLTPFGGWSDVSNVFLDTKTATQLKVASQRTDEKDYPDAATIDFSWLAII